MLASGILLAVVGAAFAGLGRKDWCPGDPLRLTDERSAQQRLRLMTMHGACGKANSRYRLGFIGPAAVGPWGGGFQRGTEPPGSVWRAFVDGMLM